MIRCKTCRVMLDIHPIREKKYRCMGCKTVFPGAIYYKYGSSQDAPYQSAGASSSKKSLMQKAKNMDAPVQAEFEDFADFDLGLDALTSSEPVSSSAHNKFVQGATQIQPPMMEGGLSPESLAPYQIKRQMAQGGMGVIYEAIHPQFGRVALKLLPNAEDVEDVDVHRFIREGEALKNLKHPNIIPFCESGVISKRHYIAMKYQEGMTLDKVLTKRGKFSPQDASKLVIPLLSALSHAHQQNILHRDLKPENIIVDPNGVPMLMDFGIVKLMGEKETKKITAKGTTVGTPAYMSPEQAQGKNLTPACDLYSIGAILYELLSGNCPYGGNNAVEIMKNVVHQPLRPLSYHGNFPAEIAWICETALEKNPEARFQSADEMSTLIGAFLEGKSLIQLKTMVPDRSKFASKSSSKYSGLQKGSRSPSRVSSVRSGASRSGVRRSEVAPKKNSLVPFVLMATFFVVMGVVGGILYTEFQKKQNSSEFTQNTNSSSNTTEKDPKVEQETRIVNLLAQAEETLKNNDPEAAEAFYKEVLLADPKNQKALLGRCEVLYAQRYIPQTLNYLESYLNSYRKDWDAHQLKIKCLRENKESQSSYEHLFRLIEHLEQMQEIFPEKLFQILLTKAEVCEELAQQGNTQFFDQAIQIYQSLRAQQPKDAKVYTKLGNLYLRYLQQSDTNTVIECFTQASQMEPDNPEVQGNLGIAFVLSNRIEEGLPLLEKVLTDPKNESKISKQSRINFLQYLTQSYFLIAEQLVASGEVSEQNLNKKFQSVISYGKQLNTLLIEEKQSNSQVMIMIAQSYFRMGDSKNAKKTYDDAAGQYNRQNSKMMREAPLILEKRAEFYFLRSNIREAIAQLELVAGLYQSVGQYEHKNRIEEMIAKYKKVKEDQDKADSSEDEKTTEKKEENKKEENSDNKKEESPKKEKSGKLDTLDDLEKLIDKKVKEEKK